MSEKTETLIRDYITLLSLSGVMIALDQWTKWLVRTNIPFRGTWLPASLSWLSPYARIVHWSNSGAAFGSFQNSNPIFIVLSFVVIGVILFLYSRVDDWYLRFAMGLYMSGVAGNLIDRLMRGTVTDFISVGSFDIFNLADSVISIAVIIVILGALSKERKTEPENKNDGESLIE
ncbi:MAG: signal peptidase II [Chloroflexi bacterium]|nr:signal peptidase II [Chloroflexota bacterium]MCL5611280.1 signal peptidase II [Chloroflexota bacterium]